MSEYLLFIGIICLTMAAVAVISELFPDRMVETWLQF